MLCNSWIIVSKETGKAIFETWQESVTRKVNTRKYEVLTAYDYLCGINRKIAENNAQ